jgi:hypothetical protein
VYFEEPVIRVMIQNWLIPELTNTGIMELVWFQYDGTQAHVVSTVNVINRSFWDGGLVIDPQYHHYHCHVPT